MWRTRHMAIVASLGQQRDALPLVLVIRVAAAAVVCAIPPCKRNTHWP